ncbi:MAG TPA: TolC family protein [Chromatiales bacterium]|nr:TolC family protein [Chromatiales bacterium]
MDRAGACLLWAWLVAFPLQAEEKGLDPLPQPLTLETALAMAEDDHPELEQADARLRLARAQRLAAEADNGLELGVELSARVIEPSRSSSYQQHNDSFARLYARKRLYDFGRTRWRLEAEDAEIKAREWSMIEVRRRRRIEVMSRFFDVHLADLENARDTEAMAVAFVRLDKGRERHRLEQLSDVGLLELEADYQAALHRQRLSEARQRTSRARLAAALNRPAALPAELAWPELPELARTPEEYEPLVEMALSGNPHLQSLRAALDAEKRRMRSARAGRYPVVRGEVEAAEYRRPSGGRAPLAAGIAIEIPLYDGGRVAADTARHRARLHERRSELAAAEMEIRQGVLELWSHLNTLRVRRAGLNAVAEYRELYLDRSRALYEMEVTSDLGDAMVRISDYRLQRAENDFELALTWARLDALVGRDAAEANERGRRRTKGEE